MVKVLFVDTSGKKVSLGSRGSFIPDKYYSFDEINEKGKLESSKGKFKKIEIDLFDLHKDQAGGIICQYGL